VLQSYNTFNEYDRCRNNYRHGPRSRSLQSMKHKEVESKEEGGDLFSEYISTDYVKEEDTFYSAFAYSNIESYLLEPECTAGDQQQREIRATVESLVAVNQKRSSDAYWSL